MLHLLCLSVCLSLQPDTYDSPAPFTFKAGDRVVFLGSTWIEREQEYGYWETALTVAHPDKKLNFRNLGRSGDTVWGDAWAEFDTAKEGYARRLQHVKDQKPTVIFLGYGWNESFAGSSGLTTFRDQYRRLVTDLAPLRVRVVFLEPPRVTVKDPFVPDVPKRLADQREYAAVTESLAREFHGYFQPNDFLFQRSYSNVRPEPLSSGWYYSSAFAMDAYLQTPASTYTADENVVLRVGEKRSHRSPLLRMPPPPAAPGFDPPLDSTVLIDTLEPGTYSLKVDGQLIMTAKHSDWQQDVWGDCFKAKGAYTHKGPSLDQAELLRQTIVEKNKLFFHRVRPQNDTYLFGFRKHEQGQNAQEIPQFEPLIEALEKKIDELKKPKPHTYELVREPK